MADKTILQKIVERGHYKFVDRVDSWQEGVKLSCESLAKTGYVSDNYYQQIVDCIEKYGPYVVFEHYVAMPHSQEGAEGANQTAVGFMRVKEDVDFGKRQSPGGRHVKSNRFPKAFPSGEGAPAGGG